MPDLETSGRAAQKENHRSALPDRHWQRPDERQASKTFGAIDLGTNNCRLLVARSVKGGFRVIDSFSKVVRLGEGLARSGLLAQANMDAAVEAIGICAEKMKKKSVSRWRCIATQACREAENGDEFLARVKTETGLRFETISPRIEARLSVMGCMDIVDPKKQVALVVDIGGGSTEMSWVDIRRIGAAESRIDRPPISAWVSLPIGVVNLSEIFPEEGDIAVRYSAMKEHVRGLIEKSGSQNRFGNVFKAGRGHIIGTSGTITSLTGAHMNLPYYQRGKVDGKWVKAADLVATARRMGAMDFEARSQVPCIGEDRAGMLVAGCAIFDVIYELWPCERVRVADRGLREGMLMGLMKQTQMRHKAKRFNSRPSQFGGRRG